MSQIHFIGGEKGGVGKSVVARLLAQYFIDNETPFKVFDADLSHGAMMRYYEDYTDPIDISKFEEADRIAEHSSVSGTASIVDMAAQTSKFLNHWITETGLIECAEELELNLTFWHVMDDGSDTLKLLHNLFESYGDKPDYVLVRNFGRGNSFKYFDETFPVFIRPPCAK
jgi:cellulose biosynthesis protein BcsQ